MAFQPDPLRDRFIQPARALLERAYARPGLATATRLADPGPVALAWCAANGINPFGPDDASAANGRGGGGLNCHSRWMRGFVRCLYEQHRWWWNGPGWRSERRTAAWDGRPLHVTVGRAMPVRGIIPAGRQVSVTFRPRNTSSASHAYMARVSDQDKTFTGPGFSQTAGRWSDPERRSW